MLAGAVIVRDPALAEQLKFLQNGLGAICGAFDSFMLLRGLKTLAIRMERHCANGLAIAQHLEKHPAIRSVRYPGLASHPQHELARRQMTGGFGGIIAAELKGDLPTTRRFLERCHLFSLGESLGGVESLIEHPGLMTHSGLPAQMRADLGISDGLVRLSVGIESVRDLLTELDTALA